MPHSIYSVQTDRLMGQCSDVLADVEAPCSQA